MAKRFLEKYEIELDNKVIIIFQIIFIYLISFYLKKDFMIPMKIFKDLVVI